MQYNTLHNVRCRWSSRVKPFTTRAVAKQPYPSPTREINITAPTDIEYDAVIIGGGMGGLATAAKLVTKGAKVIVLEK